MIKNRKFTFIALASAVIGLAAATVALLSQSQKNEVKISAESAASVWDGTTRTAYSDTTVSYNGGTYYVIASAAEFAYVATNSDSWTRNFIVTCDIDLGNYDWTPIAPVMNATSLSAFSGIFDFNGHIVSNLSITANHSFSFRETYCITNVGLFSNNNGTIRNLNLRDVTLNVTSSIRRCYVGAVAGYNGGTIESTTLANLTENVTFNRNYYLRASEYENAAGAVVGFNGGTVKNALYLSGSVAATNNVTSYYNTNTASVGTVYGDGDDDCTTTNVYVDTDATTSSTSGNGSVSDNTSTSTGDLSTGTVEDAITTINDNINEGSSTEGNATLPVTEDSDIVFGGSSSSGSGSGSSSSSSSGTTQKPKNEVTDLLANFLLLQTCVDYNNIDSYWNAYTTDATVRNQFDSYVIQGDETAGSRLTYMHNYAASKAGGTGANSSLLEKDSNEGQALIIVGGVALTLTALGFFLLKRKAA